MLGVRSLVAVILVVIAGLLATGCGGGEQSGEESGGQYEGSGGSGNAQVPGPTNAVTTTETFSEEECLAEASDSGEPGVEVSDPGQVPPYEVAEEGDAETGKELEVNTEAKSREELQKVAEKLRYENRGTDALAIDFYNGSEDDRQDAGLALVFNTRGAACRAFQYTVEDQNELVSESNGISVLSVEEGV
ncbi:hypothetical protein [Rubrobacter aplysinae]|uniref:hypothetical protein n=1 Tax=Rubrobacter aplysinae TaxID=909625 RepID=UPI001364CB00|nr:hypothetical protein [Rubrobacter aplysinae]